MMKGRARRFVLSSISICLATLVAFGYGGQPGGGSSPGPFQFPPTVEGPFEILLGGGLEVNSTATMFDFPCGADSQEEADPFQNCVLDPDGGMLSFRTSLLQAWSACYTPQNTAECLAYGSLTLDATATNEYLRVEGNLAGGLFMTATDAGPLCTPCGPDFLTSSAAGELTNTSHKTVAIMSFHLDDFADLIAAIDIAEDVTPHPLHSYVKLEAKLIGVGTLLRGTAQLEDGIGQATASFRKICAPGNYAFWVTAEFTYEGAVEGSCCDLRQVIDATVGTLYTVELQSL